MARFSHTTEMQLKMTFLGYKVESIRPLNDARAVEMGANFLGEAIIFGVAGSLIIFENARSRMNARDRKNHVDDSLDNLMIITSELREEIKDMGTRSDEKIEALQNENAVLRKTLSDILDVSLRLRNHTPYTGQEIGIGDTSGGFILQLAEEPTVRNFPSESANSSTTSTPSVSTTTVTTGSSSKSHNSTFAPPTASNDTSAAKTGAGSDRLRMQSSYDFHQVHQHHFEDEHSQGSEFLLIDQHDQDHPTGSHSSDSSKKGGRWNSLSWFSSDSSSGSPKPTAA
ncbi:hypothetical protein BGW38_007649 [Lunasporangiospora selenospora]|uniref:OPA3-domain-containing protein n=1 Tax=Lunasporangiospora selenospora TaxID=979761 RepID=A0A9P6KGT3_9FUNG|nr:hypothetical protein BGW38_007649 [Lunasporangiospora selenospora]